MSPLQVFQLRGRHVRLQLLLLSALLWLPVKSYDPAEFGCQDPDLNITRAIGEQWLLPNCGGVATCRSSASGALHTMTSSCPETSGCQVLEEGDPSATFPRCCPRLSCQFCYSEELDRYFGPGSRWTLGHCVQHRCELGRSGSLLHYHEGCEPLGPPPSLDCEVVEQDMSRGEYPLCCAHYRCPGLCKSGDTWRSREVRGDSCDKPQDTPTGWLPWN